MSRRAESRGFRSARSSILEDSSRAGNVIVRALELSCLKATEASREEIPRVISTRFTKLPPGAHENAPIIEPNG